MRVYDLHGQPIKVGSLVATPSGRHCDMMVARVAAFLPGNLLSLGPGERRWPSEVVVLEEPVWPNT